MSSSEINIQTWLPSAEVTLLDHAGVVVATSSGGELRRGGLDAGLYRVQVETGATLTEDLVAVHEGASVDHQVQLLLPTVTPVKGAAINHGLHSGPASQLSTHPTETVGAGARLMLFVRVTQLREVLPTVGTGGLALLDEHGRPLLPAPLHAPPGPGYAGLSVDLDPGTYLLRAPVEDGRTVDQSVTVPEGWTTYLFLPAAPDRRNEMAAWVPEPRAMVAHLKELGQAFEPYDHGSDAFFAAEMALDGLRAGQLVLPFGGWDQVLLELELNPMLGIYLGHAALARPNPPVRHLEALAQRLHDVVPGHPDAAALRLALLDRAGDLSASGTPPLSAPPMLRSSYQAVIARDSVEPTLLEDGSLAELVASRQRADGVWLRWDTPTEEAGIEVDTASIARAASVLGDLVNLSELFPKRRTLAQQESEINLESGPEEASLGSTDWFDLNLPAEPDTAPGLMSQEVTDLAAMLSRMAEHGADSGPVSVGNLSRQLGLPLSTVRAGLVEIARSGIYAR